MVTDKIKWQNKSIYNGLKMKIMRPLLTVTIFFLFTQTVFAQEYMYDIKVSGKEVGKLLVTKKVIDEHKTYFSAVSEVSYSFFGRTNLQHFYEAVFEDGILKDAYFVHKKDGEKKEESKISRIGNGSDYLATTDGEQQRISGLIKKSMVQLYFQKPLRRDEAFSERFHENIKIARLEENGNAYLMAIPSGDKNIYEYNEQGICSRIEVDMPVLKFEMVLNNGEED